MRQKDLEEGFENTLPDPEPVISQDSQLERQQNVTIKRILLQRMHADLSRYLTQFFGGYRKMAMT